MAGTPQPRKKDLLQYAVLPNHRIDPATLTAIRRACAAFLTTLKSDYIKPSEHEPPLTPIKLLESKGIPIAGDRAFDRATKHINRRRRLLLALVQNDGWSWDAVASSLTTNRARHLDDDTIIEDLVSH